jgi:hypothetical protein
MRDERAVSTTVNYVLALAISSLLVSGLLIAGGNFVDGERQRVTSDELAVLGGQLAEGYVDADGLAETGSVDRLAVRVTLAERAAGSGYTVAVVNRSSPTTDPYRYDLVLESEAADVSTTVSVRTNRQAVETTVDGGRVVVRLADPDSDGSDELVLDSDPLTPPVAALLPVGVGGPFAHGEVTPA